MAAPVSDVPKMGVEMMLERIMGAMEKQVRGNSLNCDERQRLRCCRRQSRVHDLDAFAEMR